LAKRNIGWRRAQLSDHPRSIRGPKTADLPLITREGKTHIVLPKLDRYMALFLKLA
jgi:hypothetical protein